MAQRTVIKTPFPSPSTIAKRVGLSRARFLAIARELGPASSATHRKARKGRNSQAGETIRIPARSQVVSHSARKAGIAKKVAPSLMEELVTLAAKEAKSTGKLVIPGLGKAVKVHRKAREGRNRQTGETIHIPAKTVVEFRLSKSFKDDLLSSLEKKG